MSVRMYNQFIKNTINKYRLVIGYGLIGVIASSLDFSIFTVLSSSFSLNYQVSNIISVHLGMLCSFILNRQLNFKVKDSTVKRFLIFYCVAMFGLLISAGLLYWFVDKLSFDKVGSKLVVLLIVALIQFILHKTITFKKKR